MKFATKAIWQCPPYLRHVATLPCKVRDSLKVGRFFETQCITHFSLNCHKTPTYVLKYPPLCTSVLASSSLVFFIYAFRMRSFGNKWQRLLTSRGRSERVPVTDKGSSSSPGGGGERTWNQCNTRSYGKETEKKQQKPVCILNRFAALSARYFRRRK